LENGSESSSTVWRTIQDWLYEILKLIDVRLALAIGLIAFLVAVGFDSAGNHAAAADLANRGHSKPVVTVVTQSSMNTAPAKSAGFSAQGLIQPNDPRLATARRLHHGTLTGAVITSSRLTQAHFFTDLPSSP
jgi:hypothetical protein